MAETSKGFEDLGFSEAMLYNLKSLGYLEMTPIQEKGLPLILSNRDFIGQANTGSGKTAAFALGILTKLDLANQMPQALVLDEADRLLETGTIKEINHIASFTPVDRQTMLFSATFPNGIKALSASLQEDAAQVTIDSQHQTGTTTQLFFEVEKEKNEALLRLLGHYQPESCIIFCNSREVCNQVAGFLRTKKMDSLQIHSDLEQQERTLILIKFDNRTCRILVATDLASRGLDVKDVGAVINYDLPSDHELYIHRIGRTGRAGQKGLALSLYTHKERPILKAIEAYLKIDCLTMELDGLKKIKPLALRSSMLTLYISGGRKDNIRPGDILGALTKDAGLNAQEVGKIHILEVNSYVAVAHEKAEQAIECLNAGKIKGKRFKVGKV